MEIDWKLLRKQKRALLRLAMDGKPVSKKVADGLINLIDSIQDSHVACGSATEHEVFGGKIYKHG